MAPLRRRETDDYPLAGIVEWAKRYAIFWIPLLWLGSNLGFGIITPRLTGNQIKALIDTSNARFQQKIDIVAARETALETVHQEIRTDISALVKFDCLDKKITDRDKALSNLRCENR